MRNIAVILAAGVGSRLLPIADYMPKSLVKVAGKSIIEYQINGYLEAGLEEKDITIVVGYMADKIRNLIFSKYPFVNIIENSNYRVTNNMYSLYLALKKIYESNIDFKTLLINNADCLYELSVIKNFINNSKDNAIAVNNKIYIDESMKVTLCKDGAINNIAKTITEKDAYGVSIDLYKYSKKAVDCLFSIVKNFIEDKKELNHWTEVAFPELFKQIEVYPCDINNGKWVEVDNYDDLKMADKLFSDFDLKSKKCLISDLDGTIYIGDTPIKQSVDFIINNFNNFDFYFLTNNTSKTPSDYVKKLNKFGIQVSEDAILSPLQLLIDFIKARGYKSVYLVANSQVYNYVKERLSDVDLSYDRSRNQAAILTYDTEINYEKLKNICPLLNNHDIQFIATHSDHFCPTENGGIPDIGSMISLIESTINRRPDIILGKPNTLILSKLLKKYERKNMAFIGDRLYTDKKLADNAGMDFICVLSGETTRLDIAIDTSKFPSIIVDNLGEL